MKTSKMIHAAIVATLSAAPTQATPYQLAQSGPAAGSARMFAQITKVDAEKREVWGRLVQEVPDRAGEIFDYESSKPYFKAWNDEFATATDGKSLGNMRAMHGKVAAGKFTHVEFNDAEKAIDVCGKVVDDAEWKKVLEGVYTGYSIGGSYVGSKKAEKVDGADVLRYTAKPSEGSLVDSPCIPTAKFFDIVKADGVIEKVAFQPPALEVTGTDDQVAEFADALNKAGLGMADAIALVKAHKPEGASAAEPAPAAAAPAAPAAIVPAEGAPVDKGMWNVQDFASCLACIASVAASAESDAQWEKDGSVVPEKLRSWLATGVAIFKAMAKEEADEMLASLTASAGPTAGVVMQMAHATRGVTALRKRITDPALTVADAEAIAKEYGEPLGDGFADRVVAKALAKADHAQKIHDMLGEMGAKCAKAAATGDLSKAADLSAQLGEAMDRIKKLEAQPVPFVTLRAVAKGGAPDTARDVSKITLDSLKPEEFLKNADGSIDYTTSLHVAREKALASAGNS